MGRVLMTETSQREGRTIDKASTAHGDRALARPPRC